MKQVRSFALKPLAIVLAALLASACGGGGGGGGGTSNPVRPPDNQPSATSPGTPPAVSEGEIDGSSYIAQSGTQKAWDQGYSGKGVTVAILDSGLAAGLSEFSGRVHEASGNLGEDSSNNVIKTRPVTDDQGHGTWVASVLAAGANNQGTVGVAPEATLLSLGFFGQADMVEGTDLWINLDRLAHALSESRAAGASVVNGSFTLDDDSPTVRTALQQSVAAGQLLVFAAGNGGGENPSLPARHARESWANGQIIAVGAVDANNLITDYSNRAGDAMQFFLVARGDVTATDTDGSLLAVAGTSFAAPQVSGASALIKQKWPQLTASRIADVLFSSATDLGTPGTDAVYGRGLLNVERAMQPMGQITVATAGGTSAPLAATGLSLPAGGVASAVARASARGALTVAATDSFGRDFGTDLAPRVSQAGSLVLADMQEGLARDIYGVERHLGRMRFSLTPVSPLAGERSLLGSRSFFGYGERSGWQFAGGSTDRLDHFFGLESRGPGPSHPYFGLARDGQFAGAGLALSDHSRIRAGALTAASASGQVMDFAYSSRSRFQTQTAAGDWALALTAGTVAEKDRRLGMAGSGALALAPGRSSFATLGARYWLDSHTEIGGSFTLGHTGSSNAGLLQFSPLTAWSAEARIVRSDSWVPGDRLSLSLGKPMAIRSGTLSMVLPARIAEDGRLGFRESWLDLAGGRTETRLGLSYALPESKAGKVSLGGMYRLNAENEPGRREALFGLQYGYSFN